MNRKTLLGRFTPLSDRTADRPEHHRVHLEPLEERKVLATVYVNDTWVSLDPGAGNLSQGDTVISDSGGDDVNGVTGTYGVTAFGIVKNATGPTNGVGWLVAGEGGATQDTKLIHDAITASINGDIVSIIEGTYTESDIVIRKQIRLKGSNEYNTPNDAHSGIVSGTETVLVPEATSARAEQEFPDGSHSAVIIYSPSVTVSNLSVNGSGNGGVGTFQYHQGITTLYELQNGPGGGEHDYVPIRGANMSLMAPWTTVDQNRIEPHLLIADVVVENVWYHGITLSAPTGRNFGRTGTADENQVQNSVVNNVGDTLANQGVNHIGILIQNLDDYNREGGGNAFGNWVTNAGIGMASNAYGVRSWNGRANARNDSTMSFNHVINAKKEAYRNDFLSGGDFIQNVASWTTSVAAPTGVHSIHSDVTYATVDIDMSANVTGAAIGLNVEDSHTGVHDALPILFVNFNLTGNGNASSIGILGDNANGSFDASDADTSLIIGHTVGVTGFGTGVRLHQSVASTVPTTLFIDRGGVAGNTVGYNFGTNVVVIGSFTTPDPVVDPGTTITGQQIPNLIENYANSLTNQPTPPVSPTANVTPPSPTVAVATQPKPDSINTGNLTLGAGSTFTPLLNGDAGNASASLTLQNFNTSYFYSNLVDEDHINPWRPGFASPSRLGLWSTSHVTQNGGGTLVIGGGATQLGAVFDIGSGSTIDVTTYQRLQVIARLRPGNTAAQFALGMVDIDGTSDIFFFPTSAMNTSTYTTFSINILSPPVRFQDGDGIMNLSAVSGWAVAGDLGSTDYDPLAQVAIEVDDISFTRGPKASVFNVTGTVNLGGATLDPTLGQLYSSSIGQSFTIVNNNGSTDTVTGTFAGLAEGATLSVGGDNFTISYVGGDGNDVVLTQVPNSGAVAGRHLFYNRSSFDGNNASINTSDDLAIAIDKSAYLPGDGLAVFENVSSYSRGINGIMIDFTGGGNRSAISLSTLANDFVFKVGNNNTPSSWASAPTPNAVSVRTNFDGSGTDRVEITWTDGDIKNQWLEVQVLPTSNTGLGAADVFFWGNKIGDIGSPTATSFSTTAAGDAGPIISGGLGPAGGITNVRDIDRSNVITAAGDRGAATSNIGAIVRINIGTGGPFAPEGGGGGDAGIASALAGSGSVAAARALPVSVVNRLDSGSSSGGSASAYFAALAASDSGSDDAADDDDGDLDELLASLAAGL